MSENREKGAAPNVIQLRPDSGQPTILLDRSGLLRSIFPQARDGRAEFAKRYGPGEMFGPEDEDEQTGGDDAA